MSQTIDQVYRDYNTHQIPASGDHEPVKAEIRALLKMIQNSGGQAVTRNTLSALNGVTPPTENYMGVVLNDPNPANNGYYYRSSGAWVKGRGFPDTFAKVALSGSGTAQTGAVDAGVNPSDVEVFFAEVQTENTGPLTLSISGGSVRPVVNLAGNPLSAGEWTGVVMFFLNSAGQYQLMLDAGAAASAAQSASDAEDAQQAAELARDQAQAAASSVSVVEFSTVAAAEAYAPISAPDFICTASHSALKYGGGMLYERVGPEPVGAWSIGKNLRTIGSAIGDLTGGGGLAAAFDDAVVQAYNDAARNNPAALRYIGRNFGAARSISHVVVYGTVDHGYINGADPSITMTLYGKNGSAPASANDGVALGSITFTDTFNEASARVIPSNTQDAYQYVWIAFSGDGTNPMAIGELQIYEAVYTDVGDKFFITLNDGVTQVWYRSTDAIVMPEMFGAKGDGDGEGNGTDDADAFQACLNSARGRLIELDSSKIYKCQKALHMPPGTSIKFNGSRLDFSDITELDNDFNSATKLFMDATGRGSVLASVVTASGSVGSFTLNVRNGGIFQPKDWVQVRAEDSYIYNNITNVKKGEIKQIESIAGNVITFTTPLLDNYTTANRAAVHKIEFSENIHLDRPNLIGSDVEGDKQEAIRLWWAKDFTVRDCHITGVDFRNIHIVNSIIGDVDGGYVDGVRYTGVGSTFYAVVTNNSAQWINVRGLKAQECRHLYVCSSSVTQYGQPLYVTVSDCHLWNAMAGTAFASYAYEHHGFGRFITITDSTADGCLDGLRVEGPDLKVQRMIFRNVRGNGIRFTDGRLLENIEIDDITISFATADNTGTHIGVWLSTNLDATIENVSITNIRLEDWVVGTTDLACRIDPQAVFKNVTFSDWKIHSPTLVVDLQQAFRIEQGDVDLVDMKIHNWPRAFRTYAGANNVNIINPIVTCDSAPATTINAFQLEANDAIVVSPVLRNVSRPFSITGNDNWVLGYASKGAGVANTDSGSGTKLVNAAA